MEAKFSAADWPHLAVNLVALAPVKLVLNLSQILSTAWMRGIPLRPYVACACIKVLLSTFTPQQIQYLAPSTSQTYKTWIESMAKKPENKDDAQMIERLQYEVQPLAHDCSIMWVGNRRKATKVVLFLHGGGYIVPMLPGHLEWAWRAYVAAGIESETEVAVAVLQYTLCPEGQYPVQLRQAVEGLQHLLSLGFKPEDIVFGGDSAGGNLSAQLFSHLVQPHPTVQEVTLSQPLAGAFLVSPWLTQHTTHVSFSENVGIDMLSAPIGDNSTQLVLGQSETETETERQERAKLAFPLDDTSYLKDLSKAVSQLYVTGGEQEVFRDQIVTFVDTVKKLSPGVDVRFDLRKNQGHDFILLEGQEGQNGESMDAMKSWMKDILSGDGTAVPVSK